MSTDVLNKFSIKLNGKLATQYEQQAAAQGREVEVLIAERLAQCVDLDNSKGRSFKIEAEDRQAIERALNRSFANVKDLIHFLTHAFKLTLNGLEIQLNPEVLRRLEARKLRMEYHEFVQRVVREEIERYVGMR